MFDAASSVSEDVIALECMFADSRIKAAQTESEPPESVVFVTTSLILLGPLILLVLFVFFWIGVHIWQSRKQAREAGEGREKKEKKDKKAKYKTKDIASFFSAS